MLSGWTIDEGGSAHAIAMAVIAAAPAPVSVWPGIAVVAIISGGVIAVINGSRGIIGPVIRITAVVAVSIVRARERTADDGADGQSAERGPPPSPSRVRCPRSGERCGRQGRRSRKSSDSLSHGITSE